MTGYVAPMPGEINAGLNTLGVAVDDGWAATVVALGTPDGGLTPATVAIDSSGDLRSGYPKDALVDPPNFITQIFSTIFTAGAPPINGQYPSEFTRPWRWPGTDNQGHTVNIEQPQSVAGSFFASGTFPPTNANALFVPSPGSAEARQKFESAHNESETNDFAAHLLPQGKHLGDPVDYTAYVVAKLTREGLAPANLANFNLDADRGYGYLTWDWLRFEGRRSVPGGFKENPDPSSPGNVLTAISTHMYPTPVKPGYGWSESEQTDVPPLPSVQPFDPDNPDAGVRIRYINLEGKFL